VFLAHTAPEERRRLYRADASDDSLIERRRRGDLELSRKLAPLEKDVSLALQRGFALSNEEHLVGTRGLAAPIFGPADRLQVALSLGLPKILLPDKMILETSRRVRKAALDISRLLGYKAGGNGTNRENIELTKRNNTNDQ
jgi:DNA-binding IclR family transcriptional regulator